jgi:hypothetical protein
MRSSQILPFFIRINQFNLIGNRSSQRNGPRATAIARHAPQPTFEAAQRSDHPGRETALSTAATLFGSSIPILICAGAPGSVGAT